jgi:hypothetical protein
MAYIGRTTDGFGVRQRFLFTPDAGATSVSGNDASGATLTFSDSVYMDVFLNGVLLKAGTDYNTNTANTIAGLTATVANDEVTVLVYDIFTTADMVSATSGGTFSGNVTHSGTVTVDDTTDSTSTTTGSIQTDGGLGVAKDLVVGDDLFLKSDSAVLNFGADNDINITHVADTGLTTNGDFSVGDDLKLNSDGAVLGFGADNEITLTHVHNSGLRFEDNDKLIFGADGDFEIYHDSSNLYCTNSTGILTLRAADVRIKNVAGNETMAQFDDDGAVNLYYDNTLALSTASAGAVTVANGLTLSDGNLVLASGHGIDFSATGDGSATDTSELLDDYEEGTWVPTITGGSNPSFSTSVAAGKYIKVGNLVFVQWNMIITGVSSQGSGNAQVGGLPYASNCNTYQGHIGIMYNDVWDTEIQKGYVPNGQSHIQLAPDGRTQSNFGFASTLGTGYFGGGGSYITG